MADRDLLLGVLAAQEGFATLAQVRAAASARMGTRDRRSVLDHLVDSGVLTPAQREMVLSLADAALQPGGGSAEWVLRSMDGAGEAGGGAESVPAEREGQYVRLDLLGRGGQSIVWRARDRFMQREVALKELASPEEGESPGTSSAARSRFLREARLTGQLDHPGIVPIYDLAQQPDGALSCVQKLVRGRTLKSALAGCPTLRQRLDLLPHLVDAAQAMAYAHARGVVHRDLKPSNVMVGEYGETVVVDWGLAKRRSEPEPPGPVPSPDSAPELTQAGEALGTPAYMSPEQARGDTSAIDERSDVFSLGTMLYELLTGWPPFAGATNTQVMESVLAGRFAPVLVRNPDAPPELAAIAERALRSAPEERYPDAAAMAGDLVAYRAGRRVGAYSYGALELVRKFIVRNRALSAAIGAALLILMVSAGVVVFQLRQARVNLAAALVERARRAEDVSDWARAAAFYAASRVENDSEAARWGIALARERVPERSRLLQGPPGTFSDVDVLQDGTLVALEKRGKAARLYEVMTGRTLWTTELDGELASARITDGTVRLRSGRLTRVFDEMTGKEMFTSDWEVELLCGSGPATRRARIERPAVLHVDGAKDLHVEAALRSACAISPDGDRLGMKDRTGVVRLFDLRTGRETASRPAPDAQELAFTQHGLAVVRSGSLQLFDGAEGDFSVEVPGRVSSGYNFTLEGRSVAVSPDGHRLAVDSPTLDRADVVDLRDRSVFVSVNRPPGEASYAFSPDGSTLHAAGLEGGRKLVSWKLRRPEARAHASGKSRLFLRMARGRFGFFEVGRGFELRSEAGNLLLDVEDPEALDAAISADGSTLALSRPHQILVQRADDRRDVARVPCELCRVVQLSADGTRLLGISSEAVRVWELSGPSLLREESSGGLRLHSGLVFSPGGERFGWGDDRGFVLEEVSSGARSTVSMPAAASWASFSPDGGRLAVIAPGRIGVWRVPDLESIWTSPNPSSISASMAWSEDGSVLIVAHEGAGADLLDGRTGESLARIVEGRTGAAASQVNVLPSLRYRLDRSAESWTLTAVPSPDTSSPRASLRRTLAEGGFRLRGVELEEAVP